MKEKLEFKIASEDWEFEQIAELNYKTFVEEIPQHERNGDKSLLDKFHSENTYIICTRGKKLLGMMAVRDKRPFSLDHKLHDIDSYLPDHNFACEFRLLSIEQEHRNLRIIQGLLLILARFADEKGYDIALISANVKRLRFYRQFGFKAFGPEVGSEEALYQPMYLTLKSSLEFREKSKILTRMPNNYSIKNDMQINLLPGPVNISPEVKQAMTDTPVSHRSLEFKKDFNKVRTQLCNLVSSENVEIFMGSGSLANDVIASQLSVDKSKGLIMSNGEFGERLIDHANRVGLQFAQLKLPWGEAFEYQRIEKIVETPEITWIWFVHSETSTGVLNDLESLKLISNKHGALVCVDCVSSLGLAPVDLSGVYLASGVSGKGLASYPGLSFVFYNHKLEPSNSIPRYLDLGFYAASDGIPFTLSSNQIYALGEALKRIEAGDRFIQTKELTHWARAKIADLGFEVVAPKGSAMPGIVTISLPEWLDSQDLGQRLQDEGYLVHWRSEYLINKNWLQIAFMSRYTKDEISAMFEFFKEIEKPLRKAL